MRWRDSLLRIRGELRAQLTPGERAFWYLWTVLILSMSLVTVGLALWGRGTARGLGIGLLFVTLVVYAVPISPILQGRVRRRQQRARTSSTR